MLLVAVAHRARGPGASTIDNKRKVNLNLVRGAGAGRVWAAAEMMNDDACACARACTLYVSERGWGWVANIRIVYY